MDPLRPSSRSPRIRVLPGGHLLIAATIVFGILAAHTGHNVLAALVALLLAFQAVSGFRSFGVLRGVRLSVRLPHAVDAGAVAYADVELSRPGRRGVARSLEVEAVVEGEALDVGGGYVARLAPGATARLRVPLHGRARGVARIVGWRVSSAYPCDLFRRTFRFPADHEVVVRPPVRVATPPPAERAPDATGVRRLLARGGGETRGLRPFRDGDPLRAISWRATARTGRVVVREEDATAMDRWAVVLDTAATGPALEDAVSTAAALLRHAAEAGRPVDLCLAGLDAPVVVASRRGLDVALDLLARHVPGPARAPRPPSQRRTFLVGERARAADATEGLRAPFPWVAPAPAPAAAVPSAPADLEAVRAPLRIAQAAWSLLVGVTLGAAVESPLAVAPQVAAAVAVAFLGARAEAVRVGAVGRLGLLGAAVGFGFLPGAAGGALVLVRFLAAFVASLHLRRRTSGEDGFVLAALLAETALAAALTSSVLAAAVAFALAVIAHRGVGHWHGLRARERASRRGAVVVGDDDPVALRRAADGAALAVLALAIPLFATLPRTDAPFLSLPSAAPTTEPGVPQTMRLGALGRVADGDDRVAVLVPRNDAARDAEPYLRAVAWEHFDGTEWTTVAAVGPRSSTAYDPTTGLLPLPSMASATTSARWSLTVEAAAGRWLPLPERAAKLTFADPLPSSVDRDRGDALTPTREVPVPRWRLDVVAGTPTPAASRRPPREDHLASPPPDLAARLAPEVARVVAGLDGVRARASALEAWVSARAGYALGVRLDRDDPLGDFLFGVRAGHCEYFAAALAVSLRLAGIPSRVVGGYHASLWNDTGGFWVVRRRDAHAWVEAWAAGEGWFRLDATPAEGRPVERYEGALGALARLRDALAFAWDRQVLGYDADRQRALVTALRSGLLDGFARVSGHPLEVMLALGLVTLGCVGVWLGRRRVRGTRGPVAGGSPRGDPRSVWFYGALLELLDARGWGRRGSETPRAYAARLLPALAPETARAVAALTAAHERTRFGADAMPDPAQVADWLAVVRAQGRRPRREVDTRPIVP